MDVVTFVFLAILGIAIAPKVLPKMFYWSLKAVMQVVKMIDKTKKEYRKRNKKYQDKMKKKQKLFQSLRNRVVQKFTNLRDKSERDIEIDEIRAFDSSKDILLRGKMRIRMPDGSITEDDIYLFQPRIYAGDKLLGPRMDEKGHLCNQHCYAIVDNKTNEVYSTYIPKREISTGVAFDYVSSGATNNLKHLKNFIDIEINQDEKGNYIPVDLNDINELKRYRDYIMVRKNQIDPYEFLMERRKWAEESYEDYCARNAPDYAKPIEQPTEAQIRRAQRDEEDREKRERDQENYYRHLRMRPPRPGMGTPPGGPGMPPFGPHGPGMPPMTPPPGVIPEPPTSGRKMR